MNNTTVAVGLQVWEIYFSLLQGLKYFGGPASPLIEAVRQLFHVG